jgi:hypothetical protein
MFSLTLVNIRRLKMRGLIVSGAAVVWLCGVSFAVAQQKQCTCSAVKDVEEKNKCIVFCTANGGEKWPPPPGWMRVPKFHVPAEAYRPPEPDYHHM